MTRDPISGIPDSHRRRRRPSGSGEGARTEGEPMAKVRSLHIGLNAVDPGSHGAPFELDACEADARDMRASRRPGGPTPRFCSPLMPPAMRCSKPSRRPAPAGVRNLFFLTYSGHGGQVQDVDGDEEDDQLDETWCLFDSQLRDDDINTALASYAEGVRILMLSDGSPQRDRESRDRARARPEAGRQTAQRSTSAFPSMRRRESSRRTSSSTTPVGSYLSPRSRPPESSSRAAGTTRRHRTVTSTGRSLLRS